jgi:hypothetical protein
MPARGSVLAAESRSRFRLSGVTLESRADARPFALPAARGVVQITAGRHGTRVKMRCGAEHSCRCSQLDCARLCIMSPRRRHVGVRS